MEAQKRLLLSLSLYSLSARGAFGMNKRLSEKNRAVGKTMAAQIAHISFLGLSALSGAGMVKW
jgi:hypothetical protein